MTNQRTITIHIDGICKGNPGEGAWAAVLEDEHKRLLFANRLPHTTIPLAKLTAAYRALEIIRKPGARVHLLTNLEYIAKGFTSGLAMWKAANWKGADNKPIKHKELWEKLEALVARHEFSCTWVGKCAKDAGLTSAGLLAKRANSTGKIVEWSSKSSADIPQFPAE